MAAFWVLPCCAQMPALQESRSASIWTVSLTSSPCGPAQMKGAPPLAGSGAVLPLLLSGLHFLVEQGGVYGSAHQTFTLNTVHVELVLKISAFN